MSWQFDSAVTMLGLTIENALHEQRNVGTEKQPKHEPKYSLAQLLSDDFRLPAPVTEKPEGGIQGLLAMSGKGVKVFKAKG